MDLWRTMTIPHRCFYLIDNGVRWCKGKSKIWCLRRKSPIKNGNTPCFTKPGPPLRYSGTASPNYPWFLAEMIVIHLSTDCECKVWVTVMRPRTSVHRKLYTLYQYIYSCKELPPFLLLFCFCLLYIILTEVRTWVGSIHLFGNFGWVDNKSGV